MSWCSKIIHVQNDDAECQRIVALRDQTCTCQEVVTLTHTLLSNFICHYNGFLTTEVEDMWLPRRLLQAFNIRTISVCSREQHSPKKHASKPKSAPNMVPANLPIGPVYHTYILIDIRYWVVQWNLNVPVPCQLHIQWRQMSLRGHQLCQVGDYESLLTI